MAPSHQRTLPGFEPDDDPSNTPSVRDGFADHPAPPLLEGQTVYVVDAHSLIYQVFHAMPDMTGPAGQPVGAVFGFIRDILDLLQKRRPNYLFCAFDHPGGKTFRHQMYGDYKAHRESMPADLRPQIANIQRILAALGLPVLQVADYEADDILATVAGQTEKLGGSCFLVTGDKDCRQLISPQTRIFNIRKSEVFDEAALVREWGIRAGQVVDYQALVGDPVDNVPGVPLIGPKLARELLEKYGTLGGVLDHAGEVRGAKRRENLVKYRDQALLSRDLVRLVDDAPIEVDWPASRIGGIDVEAALELCDEFGFRQLGERLSLLSVKDAPGDWSADYQLVSTAGELEQLVAQLSAQRRIVIDTETTSPSPRWAEIVGYSFSWRAGSGYYVPVRAPRGDPQLDPVATINALRPVLEDPAIEKVGQNLKYEIVVLRNLGVQLRGVSFDTMVADYLLDAGERTHGLDDLARRYLNRKMTRISDLIGTGKKQKRMDQVPVSLVMPYAAEDADVPMRLVEILERRLAEDKLDSLFYELEMPLVGILAELEFNGIKVDAERLGELSVRLASRLEALVAEIHAIAGFSFNIDSRRQLAKVLFEDLKLPVARKTKTGPSTDVEVLTQLADLHELPRKVIEYRQLGKLKSTYVDALPALIHPRTGRVHTSLKQDVAATGRLSSMDPNLQNIPIRTEEGREIRAAFLPGEDGWLLLTADYSQIELRVLAHFSGDQALKRAFAEDRDIHTQVASEVYGVGLDQVTREMRRSAKAVNFGVIYGQSPFGLAKALNIDKEEAARFIDTYFSRYQGVDKFLRKVLEECRQNGYVSTILGRRRAVRGVRDLATLGDSRQRNLPERIAINTVIQGSAADLIKQAMIRVSSRMNRERLRARMLLQIHDELMFEVPRNELRTLATLVAEEMTAVGQLDVPLEVKPKAGANWAECEPLD